MSNLQKLSAGPSYGKNKKESPAVYLYTGC